MESIKSKVLRLLISNPINDEPFYVGKGKCPYRVLEEENESDKLKR